MMKTMLHASIDERDLFLRREIARGRSGRLIVHELVRLGYCDAEKARELVALEGPELYVKLSRRYGALFTIGLVLLMTVIMAALPGAPIKSGTGLVVALISGVILAAVGWTGVKSYRGWHFELEEVDGRTSRLEGLAREMLNRGKGEWAIIHEAGKLDLGGPEAARAAVARVWPEVFREFSDRRRSIFMIGLFILALGIAPFVPLVLIPLVNGGRPSSLSELGTLALLMSIPLMVGGALVAYGWMPRRRKDHSIGLPGSTQSGPVRTGLEWNAGPFERQ